MRLIFRVLANAAAIIIAAKIVPGFLFTGTLIDLLIAGAILGLINALVKPVIKLLALPVIFLTLGLFNIVINIALLFLAAKFIPHLAIQGIWAAVLGVIIISIVNQLVSSLNKRGDINKY